MTFLLSLSCFCVLISMNCSKNLQYIDASFEITKDVFEKGVFDVIYCVINCQKARFGIVLCENGLNAQNSETSTDV